MQPSRRPGLRAHLTFFLFTALLSTPGDARADPSYSAPTFPEPPPSSPKARRFQLELPAGFQAGYGTAPHTFRHGILDQVELIVGPWLFAASARVDFSTHIIRRPGNDAFALASFALVAATGPRITWGGPAQPYALHVLVGPVFAFGYAPTAGTDERDYFRCDVGMSLATRIGFAHRRPHRLGGTLAPFVQLGLEAYPHRIDHRDFGAFWSTSLAFGEAWHPF